MTIWTPRAKVSPDDRDFIDELRFMICSYTAKEEGHQPDALVASEALIRRCAAADLITPDRHLDLARLGLMGLPIRIEPLKGKEWPL